jgi:adenylate cyclase
MTSESTTPGTPDSPSFFRELVRRRVLRVGAAYVVGAIATVEAADLLFPRLDLPDWTITLVLAVAIVGLPVTLALAWAFQVTDHGIELDSATESTRTPRAGTPLVPAEQSLPEDAAIRSIAVLPFADMSPGQDQTYLADGLAEEILNGLSRLRGLRVAARTSSFAFREGGQHVRDVGRRLGVAHLLEGSVRKWGDRIRVTAQLIDAKDGYHLWSKVYDRHLDDIFRIQDEIARAIVDKLDVELLQEEQGPILPEYTDDPEAFDLYLKGRHAWYNRYRVGLETALTYFRQALERDPSLVLAHCGVADTYAVLGLYGLMPPAEAGKLCADAADQALELAPGLPQAQFSDALCATVFPRFDERGDPIWPDDRMREIWERHPDFAEPAAWFGIARATRGGTPDAEIATLAALVRSIEPDSPYIGNMTGLILSWNGAHVDALPYLLEGLESNPEDIIALFGTANALLGTGRPGDALPHFEKVAELTNRAPPFLSMLGYGLARVGRTGDARAILYELLERQNDEYVPPIAIAAVAANVGETELALEYVDEAMAWDRHAPCSWWLRFPVWDHLHDQPAFADAFRRVGMVPPGSASSDARGAEDRPD